jgi:hypothetical protein
VDVYSFSIKCSSSSSDQSQLDNQEGDPNQVTQEGEFFPPYQIAFQLIYCYFIYYLFIIIYSDAIAKALMDSWLNDDPRGHMI